MNKRFYDFGTFRVDADERLLLRDGQVVPLTAKVFDILLILVRHRGHLLEKERLMSEVWPESYVEEGNLTRNISTLRKALGEKPDEHRFIETFPRRGYRFVAEVQEFGDEDGGLVLREETRTRVLVEEEEWAAASGEDARARPLVKTRRPVARILLLSGCVLLLLAAGAVWLTFALGVQGRRRGSESSRSQAPRRFRRSPPSRPTATRSPLCGLASVATTSTSTSSWLGRARLCA